jgi:hypothetical protein
VLILSRIECEGYARGAGEARLFRLAVDKGFQQQQALDWIGTAIDEGRVDLEAQHALEQGGFFATVIFP